MLCTMYDIIVFRSRVFVRPHENDNPAAFKKKTLNENNFQKPLFFLWPKVPLKCEQKAKTGEKIIPFQKYSDTWGREDLLSLFYN